MRLNASPGQSARTVGRSGDEAVYGGGVALPAATATAYVQSHRIAVPPGTRFAPARARGWWGVNERQNPEPRPVEEGVVDVREGVGGD